MKLPGITSLSYLYCHQLTPNLALSFRSGIPVGVFAPNIPISFHGIPECEAVDAPENNGHAESTTLSFRTTQQIPTQYNLAFLVTTASGQNFLIGTKEDFPTIQVTTVTGTPTGAPAGYQIEVKLTALKSLIPVAR